MQIDDLKNNLENIPIIDSNNTEINNSKILEKENKTKIPKDSIEISKKNNNIENTYDPASFIEKAKNKFLSMLTDDQKNIFGDIEKKLDEFFPEVKDDFIKTAVSGNNELTDSFFNSSDKLIDSSTNDEASLQPPEDIENENNSQFSASMNFDLFYSLSKRFSSENKIEDGKAFHSSFSQVIEKFSSSFKLNVQTQGKFLNNTQNIMDLAPESAGDFFSAIDGLVNMDEKSLNTFLDKADSFFNELDEQFGEADGDSFQIMKDLVKGQVSKFVHKVSSLTEDIENPQDISNTINDMPLNNENSIKAAEDLFNNGNDKAAKNIIDVLIKDTDKTNMNSLMLNNLGALLTKMNDTDKAKEYLKKAIEIDPKFAEGYSNLSMAQMLDGNYDDALNNINKAIDLQPDNFLNHHNLGRIYQLMGKDDQAIKAYNKALELNPDSEKTKEYINEIEENKEPDITEIAA